MSQTPKSRTRTKAPPAEAAADLSASATRGGIQSIERAVAILEVVASDPGGITLAEISAQLGLHNSTVFHLIKTLATLGIVEQFPGTKQYRVGSRLFMLAAGAMNENAMLTQATPILEALSRKTGEAAHLAVRSRHEIVVIARTAATGLLQLSGYNGATRPAHCTAIGKVLMAEVAPEMLDGLLEHFDFKRFTKNTITDRQTYKKELATIREKGVAYDDCEFDEDVKCIAVPVRDFAGRCPGAIGISGPIWHMGAAATKRKMSALLDAAHELSRRLGFQSGIAA
jgi:IclR family acetate operon transcriptional repressor